MNLWLLLPIDRSTGHWSPWYDRAVGFVVRADTAREARSFAAEEGGAENPDDMTSEGSPWLDMELTSCEHLTDEGEPGVIIRDFHAA